MKAAGDAFGQIDIVVNNAGYTWDGMAHKMSDEQFRAMLEIHTVVPFKVLRAAAPYLRDAGKADRDAGREVFRKVVNVTSISGTQGNLGQVNYSTAKAGLVGLTKTLAREWGAFKVNVNAVAFGFVETRLTAPSDSGETIERGDSEIKLGIPQAMRDLVTTIIPLGRAATPRGRGRPDLLSLLPVVELRARSGDHREWRPDDGDDDMSGEHRPTEAPRSRSRPTHPRPRSMPIDRRRRRHRQYHVTEEAMLAYAAATDDVPGGPVFAIVPVWETIAPASRVGRLGRGAETRRALRARHRHPSSDRGRRHAHGARDADRAAPASERDLTRDPRRDAGEDGAPVNEQYVTEFFRGIVAEESIGERAPDHRLSADGTDPLAEVAYRIAEDQTGSLCRSVGRRLRDPPRRRFRAGGRACPDGSSTASARWRSPAGRCSRRRGSTIHAAVRRVAVRFSAPLFPGDTVTTRVWRTDGGFGFESLGGDGAPVLKDGLLELG